MQIGAVGVLCVFGYQARTLLFSQLAVFRQYPYFPLAKSSFDWLLIVT